MKQINLKASNMVRSGTSSSSLSLFLGVTVLFASVVAYGLVHYQLTNVKSEITKTKDLITQKKTQMNNKKYAELYLFEDKLLDIKNKLGTRSSQSINLDLLALKTLPETVFSSISCKIDEAGTSTFASKLTVNDLDMLARQAKSFQQGENFANVRPTSSALDEQGKISSDFTFDIVNREEGQREAASPVVPSLQGQAPIE